MSPQRVHGLVTVASKEPGGPTFIFLNDLLETPISLGPYANPACAEDDAKKIREYLEALVSSTCDLPDAA